MALFLGAGRLVLNGFQQQVSDLAFRGDCELVLNGPLMAQVERIRRIDGFDRVIDVDGAHVLFVRDIIGAVRSVGGERIHISGVVGDVFQQEGGEDIHISGVVGDVDFFGDVSKVYVQNRGGVTFVGGSDCRLDVDGSIEIEGGANFKITLRSVEEDRGLILDSCSGIDADVLIRGCQRHGVQITNSSDVTIRGAVEESGQGGTFFDNVRIAVASEAVRVTGLRSRGGNTTNVGVFIDEFCTDCIVDGVDFGDADDYLTDDLVDNGTNTRIGTNWSL